MRFLHLSELEEPQVLQYRSAIAAAFPAITQHSDIIKNYWERIENYFPEQQVFMLDASDDILGFINTIPFSWEKNLDQLPDEGWDWMVRKGISDYDKQIKPNCLGGLQVIIPKEHQGKGYSKRIISRLKEHVSTSSFQYFVIPIRPTFKNRHPEIKMADYLHLRENDKIYDPWIRTHLDSGAKIIKVCPRSMEIAGDLSFWKTVVQSTIEKSGFYQAEGALNPVEIIVEKNYGIYLEENIWIYY
jgi:hypothetical protein